MIINMYGIHYYNTFMFLDLMDKLYAGRDMPDINAIEIDKFVRTWVK